MSAESNDRGAHQFILKNIPWLATLSLLALVIAKLLTVARFNPTTALTLVNNSSIFTISLGALVSGLPLLLYAVWFALFLLCGTTRRATFARRVMTVPLLFVAVLLTWLGSWLFVLTVAFSLDALLEGPIFKFAGRRIDARTGMSTSARDLAAQVLERAEKTVSELQLLRARLEQAEGLKLDEQASEVAAITNAFEEAISPRLDEDRKLLAEATASLDAENIRIAAENKRAEETNSRIQHWTSRLLYGTLFLNAIFAMTPFLDSRPWLAEERITLTDQSVHIGYVVQQSKGSIVFVTDDQRKIERFMESDVTDRFVCIAQKPSTGWLAAVGNPPAAWFVGPHSDYPLCSSQRD